MARYMRKFAAPTLTKANLLAAFSGIDGYFEANAAAMNTSIPQPARAELTTQQKAIIVAMVAIARYGGDL